MIEKIKLNLEGVLLLIVLLPRIFWDAVVLKKPMGRFE